MSADLYLASSFTLARNIAMIISEKKLCHYILELGCLDTLQSAFACFILLPPFVRFIYFGLQRH